jgi:hypothetical protein
MATSITASRQMIHLAARKIDSQADDLAAYCAMAKRFATDEGFQVSCAPMPSMHTRRCSVGHLVLIHSRAIVFPSRSLCRCATTHCSCLAATAT